MSTICCSLTVGLIDKNLVLLTTVVRSGPPLRDSVRKVSGTDCDGQKSTSVRSEGAQTVRL